MSWVEDGTGSYSNDTEMVISDEEGRGILTFEDVEAEGINLEIALDDLFDNPYFKVVVVDKDGKIPAELIPSIVIGETFFANSDVEMLSLTAQKGDVCIRKDIPGGASYRLMGDNPGMMSNWVELRARFIFWSDIQGKPLVYPPTTHNHDLLYPRIGANGKISTSVIPSLNFLGSRYVRNTEGEMLSLAATPGDVCIRKDQNKMYLCMGNPALLSSWVYLPAPDAKVESIIMKGEDFVGYVEITPESIGASPEDHEHDYILEQGGNIIKIVRDVVDGNPTLFWLDPENGNVPTPFA